MLFTLKAGEKTDLELKPIAFYSLSKLGKLEKDLENVLSGYMINYGIMPIYQERKGQAVADIYALDRNGDLYIYELKKDSSGDGSVSQLLRYTEEAGQYTFEDIERNYRSYRNNNTENLQVAHKECFGLEIPLDKTQFNNNQKLYVIANGADDRLKKTINYWKEKGIEIDFIPYRLYKTGSKDEYYFEISFKPYDDHYNPGECKGVLFDTNVSGEGNDFLASMIAKHRISALADKKDSVKCFNPGDYVFYSHKGRGIVAGAIVISRKAKEDKSNDELYHDVKFFTQTPTNFSKEIPAMPFSRVKAITGFNFYWARTDKRPYLSKEMSELLKVELLKIPELSELKNI